MSYAALLPLCGVALPGTGMGNDGCCALAERGCSGDSLVILRLSRNAIGNEGALALGAFLRTSTALQHLRLEGVTAQCALSCVVR